MQSYHTLRGTIQTGTRRHTYDRSSDRSGEAYKQVKNHFLETYGLEEQRTGVREKEIAFICLHLPPADVVRAVLANDMNPTELWSRIAGIVGPMQYDIVEINEQLDILRNISELREHSGIAGHRESERIEQANVRIAELEAKVLHDTLRIAATAMVRDLAHEYDEMRESLFSAMEKSGDTQNWKQAIRLFDIAVGNAVLNLEIDSGHGIDTGRKLQHYLEKSVDLLVDENAYKQVYEGMRMKFPELKLQPLQ